MKLPVTDLDPTDEDFCNECDALAGQLSSILEEGNYSDDIPKLNRQKYHYIFVYGTLKKGFRNHRLILNAPLVGCGFTSARNFILYNERNAKFPVALFTNNGASLYGEVYRVEVEDIRTLDNLESNGIIYKRYPLDIQTYQSVGSMQKIKAWTYVGKRDWWDSRLSRLDLIPVSTDDKFKYYYYKEQ
jgi:gamma-glutamylaminecyclotransferase